MLCLGIETSCDETAMAMVEDGRLLGEVVASQVDVHTLFGGVVPEIASREHYRLLGPLFHDLLEKTGVSAKDIAAVAVARGPGLLGSLLVGLGFAKGMALGLRTELVGVDHLHAHLLAAGLERDLVFPSLGLLVSGGHTQIWRLDSPVQLQLMGRTLDDAAGEAFDKAAKMLNLPYPGGKYIDLLARRGTADPGRFPRPYLDNKNLDFSFSGLKTAVAEYVARHPGLRLPVMMDESKLLAGGGEFTDLADVCASFNWTVAETLRIKVERALDRETLQSLTLAGGGGRQHAGAGDDDPSGQGTGTRNDSAEPWPLYGQWRHDRLCRGLFAGGGVVSRSGLGGGAPGSACALGLSFPSSWRGGCPPGFVLTATGPDHRNTAAWGGCSQWSGASFRWVPGL